MNKTEDCMTKEFSAIAELRAIREQKSVLSEREKELVEPMLNDNSLIATIYEWFEEILASMSFPPNPNNPIERKKFLFIILYLYSPSTLAGGKMKVGLRDELAKVTNCTTTLISHNCEDVTFYYNQYKSYRANIDLIYNEILTRLKKIGAIK